MGLILDSSLLIADEREDFHLATWLRARRPEPVAISAITLSELWFGLEVEADAARGRRRRRWLEKTFRRLEIVPFDAAVARIHARIWAQLCEAGQIVGPHDRSSLRRLCTDAGGWRHSMLRNSGIFTA